jgi:predicted RND superfamily exporter protein
MLHFFEKRDRWGNGLALWVVVGMVFLIPMSIWSLLSMKMENEVQDWVPKDNPDYKVAEWYRRHFPRDEVVLFTWDGSRLDDPRVERLVQKIRGVKDSQGKRRGGSKFIERVRTPQELIGQMRKNNATGAEAVDRLEGVLVGAGPLRIRLSEFGRARRDKVVECLRKTAHDALGLSIEISNPDSVAEEMLAAVDSTDSTAATSGATDEPPTAGEVASGSGASGSSGASGNGAAGETVDTDSEEAALAELARADDIPQCPAHDLVITWPGMHWDAARISAFKELADSLRLPSTRSSESSPRPIEECFQVPGSPIALAICLSEAGNADRTEAFRWLSDAAVQSGIPAASIHIGGNAVLGSALDREVLKSVWDTSFPLYRIHHRSIILLSGLAGGILAVWLLKSFRLAGLVLGVSLYTTLLSTALIPLTGGVMTMMLVVLPTLILLTTLSVALHLAKSMGQATASNMTTAVAEAVQAAFVPCLCAGLATVIGQASLMTSSLAPVRNFGMYSALGTLISLAVTLFGLPALLALWPGKPPQFEKHESSFWRGMAGWLTRHHRLVPAVCFVATGVCVWGLKSFQTESKTIGYFANSTRTVKDYESIEDRLAGIVPLDVIVRFDRESQQQLKFLQRSDLVREIQSGIEKLPEVSGSLSLADFLPVVADPGDQGHARERAKYSAASRNVEADVKGAGNHETGAAGTVGKVKRKGKSTAKSLLAMADDVTEFNAEGDELWRVTAQVAIMSRCNFQELRGQIDEICSSVLRRTSGNAAEKVPPVGALRSYHPGASHFVTGEIPLFLATQKELLRTGAVSFAAALAGIMLVVVLLLRHPLAGPIAMIPSVLSIVAVFGLSSWFGLAVDIGSVATASIALGISIAGTLHLVTRFRLGIRQGKSRAEAVAQALGHCGPAMLQTTLVVSAGLVMLSRSDVISISRFGGLMAALLATASISNLVLTPALLAGVLGYFIERAELGTPEPESTNEPAAREIEIPAPAPVLQPTVPGKPHIGKKSVRIRRGD